MLLEPLDHEGREEMTGSSKRSLTLLHATTPRKAKRYRESGFIRKPVRGFTTIQGAMAWSMCVGRTVIYEVSGEDCHKLPDHHNEFGNAWWIDHDVNLFRCVFSVGSRLDAAHGETMTDLPPSQE